MRVKLHLQAGLFTVGLCLLVFVALPARAQDARLQQENPLSSLYACQTIENIATKAECYDHATKALQTAEGQGEIIALNAAALREIQEGIFGYKHLPLSKLGIEGPSQVNHLEMITVPVKKVERYLSGYVITLDNNQVWEQFAGSISRVPKGKLSAEINTTATGAYKMALFNTKTRVSNIKVRRIQ